MFASACFNYLMDVVIVEDASSSCGKQFVVVVRPIWGILDGIYRMLVVGTDSVSLFILFVKNLSLETSASVNKILQTQRRKRKNVSSVRASFLVVSS